MRSLIARKVARLVDVIDDLHRQVRAAFAAELSKAIATTVRDVLAALLGGRPASEWDQGYDGYGSGRTGADDGWDDPRRPSASDGAYDDPEDEDAHGPAADRASAPVTVSTAAVALAVTAGRWLYRLSRSRVCGVAGALAVGLAAAFGGPLTQSVMTVAAAVNQLVGAGEAPAPPVR